MDIKEFIEKAFAVGHTIGYGNTENHYKPEFERWWNDENTQKQVKNCSIPDVSESLFTQEQFDYVMEVPEIYLRSHLLHQVRLRDNLESDRDYFEKENNRLQKENNRLLRRIEDLQKHIDWLERES